MADAGTSLAENSTASPEYNRALEEAKRHHARSKTYSGRLLRPHKPALVELARRLDIRSVLDYGCGKGLQWEWVDPLDGLTIAQAMRRPGARPVPVPVTKYDPAWPPFAAEPAGQFDLVICTHVLGSIPERDLPWVLGRIFGLATHAVYIAEKIGPVKKKVHSGPRRMWSAIEWIDAIEPHLRPGLETHLAVRYESGTGRAYSGRFLLAA